MLGQEMVGIQSWRKKPAWKGTASRSRQDPSRTQQGPRLTTFPVSPEGVLTLRARPPTEGEFVDCFQKTKLAINLLVSQPYPVLGVWVGWRTGPPSHMPPVTCWFFPPPGKAAEAHPKPQCGGTGSLPLRASGSGDRGWDRVGSGATE